MSITSTWPVWTDDAGGGTDGTILNNAQHNLDRDAINNYVGDWFGWTPTIGGSTSQSGQAYSQQVGRCKITSNGIEFYGAVTLSTLGTITGNVQIKGLPVASAATAGRTPAIVVGYFSGMTTSYVWLGGFIPVNGTAITLQGLTAAATGSANLAQANLSATTAFVFSGCYEV